MADPPAGTRTPLVDLAIGCLDLTSLDGDETREDVLALCDRAVRPDPSDDTLPSVAAVVLYPDTIELAAERLRGSGVLVASVAWFPLPDAPLEQRLDEIRRALDAGADEIDIVMRRPVSLDGGNAEVGSEVERATELVGSRTLKVILETGELGEAERIRAAALVAMEAGADFLKSSSGKVGGGVTPEAAVAMMEAARDFHRDRGRAAGIKVSGGVRTTEQALAYLAQLDVTLGPEWMTPDRFRIGASSLLDDLVAHRQGGAR